MGDVSQASSASALWLGRLLAFLSPEWILPLLQLYRSLRQALVRAEGMYEILAYDSTLELVDARGRTARFKRHQQVKFLQDHIIAFQDHCWGEGDIFHDYQISKGVAVDRYQEGHRWNVLISLRETKSKGDIEDFYIERTVRDGFTRDEEWWQVEVWHKTRWLRMSAFFPRNRHCRRAVLHTRTSNRSVVLGPGHFQLLPNGRQLLRWETKQPRCPEVYTMRWRW